MFRGVFLYTGGGYGLQCAYVAFFLWPVFMFYLPGCGRLPGGFIAASRPLFLSLSAYLGIFVFCCRSV